MASGNELYTRIHIWIKYENILKDNCVNQYLSLPFNETGNVFLAMWTCTMDMVKYNLISSICL